MLDGLSVGLSLDGIEVFYEGKWVSPKRLPPRWCFQVESDIGKRKLTLGNKQGKFTVQVNPVGWLSNQNVTGSNNAHWLLKQVFKRLIQMNILRMSADARARFDEGQYDIHQMAFNKYLECGDRDKGEVFDTLKTILGGTASHMKHECGESSHLYSGPGFISKTRTIALTFYDKTLEMASKKKKNLCRVLPMTEELRTKMRCEVTVKYGYFSKSKRRMSAWIGKDWDAEAEAIIAYGLQRFRIDYLLSCPNVFAPDYTASWKPQHKLLFKSWLEGSALDKNQRGVLLRFYGFDAELNVKAHRNTLWTLRRTMDGSLPRLSELTGVDHFPGKDLCAPLLPMNKHLCLGTDRKTLRQIAKACKS